MSIDAAIILLAIALNAFLFITVYKFVDPQTGMYREWLRYFFIFVILVFALFIPSIAVNSSQNCQAVVANSTTSGSTTTFEYSHFCYDTETFISRTYYQVFSYIWYVIIMCFILWPMFKLISIIVGKGKAR